MAKVTLYRATDDDMPGCGTSFAESRETAALYLDNPGFGGATLYRVRVEVADGAVIDLTGARVDRLAESLGLSSPGAMGVDEWIASSDAAQTALRDRGHTWARVRESYPEDTTTWIYLGEDYLDLVEVPS